MARTQVPHGSIKAKQTDKNTLFGTAQSEDINLPTIHLYFIH